MKKINPWNYYSAYCILFKDPLEILNDSPEQEIDSLKNGVYLASKSISQEKQISKQNLYESLSNEAKEVVNFVLYNSDISEVQTRKTKKISYQLLKKYFEKKWKSKFICNLVFKEIKAWVNTF